MSFLHQRNFLLFIFCSGVVASLLGATIDSKVKSTHYSKIGVSSQIDDVLNRNALALIGWTPELILRRTIADFFNIASTSVQSDTGSYHHLNRSVFFVRGVDYYSDNPQFEIVFDSTVPDDVVDQLVYDARVKSNQMFLDFFDALLEPYVNQESGKPIDFSWISSLPSWYIDLARRNAEASVSREYEESFAEGAVDHYTNVFYQSLYDEKYRALQNMYSKVIANKDPVIKASEPVRLAGVDDTVLFLLVEIIYFLTGSAVGFLVFSSYNSALRSEE